MKAILEKLKVCKEAIEWVGERTIEEAVNECPRGDWMLWLAQRLDIDTQLLTLAKGHCANTVRHLMIDERSIKAVDTAIAFGKGEATIEELKAAAIVVPSTYYATYAYASDAYVAASAASAAAFTAYAAAYTSSAAYTVAYTSSSVFAASPSVSDAHKQENQLLTANICREYLGQFIIEKWKSLDN